MHGFITAFDVVLGVLWAAAGMWQRVTGRSLVHHLSHPGDHEDGPGRDHVTQGRWMLGLGAVWLFTAAFRAHRGDHIALQVVADAFAFAAVALAFAPIKLPALMHGHGHHGHIHDDASTADPARDTPATDPEASPHA